MDGIFVGRESEIAAIQDFLDVVADSRMPSCITIQGGGGIGKTKLVERAQRLALSQGFAVTPVIDLGATANMSKLNILKNVTKASSIYDVYFRSFDQAVKNYENARDIAKSAEYEAVAETFVACLAAHSIEKPFLICLDTFEAVQNGRTRFPLAELIPRLAGGIGIIAAGRKPIDIGVAKHAEIDLEPFSIEEATDLAKRTFEERGNVPFDLDTATLKSLHEKSRGHPILISLATEWILENFQPDELVNLPTDQFEMRLVLYLRKLEDDNESKIAMLMATADRRFTSDIARILTNRKDAGGISSRLTRFFFIKQRQEEDEDVFVLHDEMRRLINEHIDYPDEFKNEIRKQLVDEFYDPRISVSTDPHDYQTLVSEKIHYQVHYDMDGALLSFDTDVQNAVSNYEFDFADRLLGQIRLSLGQVRGVGPEQLERAYDLVSLNHAELLLKQYNPLQAKIALDSLYSRLSDRYSADYRCRVLSGIGSYIINPSTSVEADPFDAIGFWQSSLQVSRENGLVRREGEILFQLACTHVIIGQHNEALGAFEMAHKVASEQRDQQLEAKILNEMGKLFRLRMELDKARPPIERGMVIRREVGDYKNFGLSFYYLANLYRDLNEFDKATRYYQLAESALLDVSDKNALCELYCDMSWFYVLAEDLDAASHYNRLSQQIAEKYVFGREISEHLHILYHLELDRGNYDLAVEYAQHAYAMARKYLNVYMILDCLMHLAQDAYKKQEYQRIPEILAEMRSLENRGCGIRAFTGRTVNVYGDYFYDIGDLDEALEQWTEGFTTIAIHGNSRTNVELFEDHLEARQHRLYQALLVLGHDKAESLRLHWISEVLDKGYGFPQIVDICDSVLRELQTREMN